MFAFFDTNVYINALKGKIPPTLYDRFFTDYVIRLCPVVYHELTRSIRTPALKKCIEAATRQMRFLNPPTTKMWIEAATLAPKAAGNFGSTALANLQNDLLIALTARENGAVLITGDSDFTRIGECLDFKLRLLPLL